MPIRPEVHSTGDTGVAAFQYCISLLKWTFEAVGKDYGLDGKVEVFQDGRAIGYMFFVQSKSTEKSIMGKKYVAEYFELPKRNYFIKINAPILIILHSTLERQTLFRWAFSEDDFEKTAKGYKFVFNKNFTINSKNLKDFSRSVMIANHLHHATMNQMLQIRFTGNVSRIMKAQALLRNTLNDFGIRVVEDQESPIDIEIDEKEVKCNLPGFLSYTDSYQTLESSLIKLFEVILLKLHSKYKDNFNLIKLLFDFNMYSFSSDSPKFVTGLNYSRVLRRLHEQMIEENFNKVSKIIPYLQLHFFELDAYTQQILISIRRELYESSNSAENYINYVIILQSAGACGEVEDLLNFYDVLDESLTYSDRFLLEYANAASKCQLPSLSLSALSRLSSLTDSGSAFLAIKSYIYAGHYAEAHGIAQLAIKMEDFGSAFIALSTYLSFLTQFLHVENQVINIKERPENVGITTAEEALKYIIEIDATHPHAWLLLAQKDSEELPHLNEPEFYATFGAMLGHGRLLFRSAFLLLIEKIYQNDPNRDILKTILVNILEEALVIRGRDFIDYLFDEFMNVYNNEAVLTDIKESFEEIERFHNSRVGNFKDHGDGFVGNEFFIPSILRTSNK